NALLFLCGFIGCAPLPILLFYQLRSLAKRARSAHLAEHCAIVGWGVGAALVYTGGLVVLFDNATRLGLGSYWTSRSNVSLILGLIPLVAFSLFILWSLYLLIRFAVAFGKASRKLRATWNCADRSLAE